MSTHTSFRLSESDARLHKPSGIHALLIEDIASFFEPGLMNRRHLEWYTDCVGRVMREYRLTGDNQHYPVLAMGAPRLSIDDVFSVLFETAFSSWLSQQRENGLDANIVVVAYGWHESRTKLLRPSVPGGRLVEFRIYTRQFFEGNDQPWLTILDELCLGLNFNMWRDDPTLSLRDRLDYGDAYRPVNAEGVTLLSALTGPNDRLEVGPPYLVPAPPGIAWDDDEPGLHDPEEEE